jgi:hypothetical protein
MHGNIVPAAPETSAHDYLDIDAAVERIAKRDNPKLTIVYRDTAAAAWRTLCKLAPAATRILTGDGLLRKPDPVQLEGFADKYWKFASILRYPPNDEGVPGEIECFPSYNLLDEHGHVHRGARLVFRKSEIEAALLLAIKPRKRLSLNDRKRAAVLAAFEALGREYLSKLRQKDREAQVIAKVAAEHDNLSVTDRYVRDLWNGH